MTVAYSSKGTAAYSNSNTSLVCPATVNAGDLLVAVIGTKPETSSNNINLPGWSKILSATGGTGTTGADAGLMRVEVWVRWADGTEDGTTVTVTNDGNNSVSGGNVYSFTKTNDLWDIDIAAASDTSTGTTFSAATSTNLSLASGDLVFAAGIIPTDVTTPSQFSGESFTASGITFETVTEVEELDSGSGNDMGGVVFYASVSSGSGTVAITPSATAGGTTTNVAGPIAVLRLRERAIANGTDAADLRENFESGTDTSAIGTTDGIFDGGGSSGSGATITYDNDHAHSGSLSMKVYSGTASGTIYRDIWGPSSDVSRMRFGGYLYIPSGQSNPAALEPILIARTDGGLNAARVILTTNFYLTTQDGTSGAEDGIKVPYDQWFRFEWDVNPGGSTQRLSLFWGSNLQGNYPNWWEDNTCTSQTTVSDLRIGWNIGVASEISYWVDDLGYNYDGDVGPYFPTTVHNGVFAGSAQSSLTANGTVTTPTFGDISITNLTPVSGQGVTSLGITLPPTLQGGDYIVLEFSTTYNGTLSLPSGWTRLVDHQNQSTSASIYGKYAAGSVGSASSEASTTITVNFGSSTRASAVGYALRGVDQTTAIDTTGTSASQTTGVTSFTYTGLTTITPKAIVIAFGAMQNSGTTQDWTQPTGFNNRLQGKSTAASGNNTTTVSAIKTFTTPAATGNLTDSWVVASNSTCWADLLTIRPAVSAVTTVSGVASFGGQSSLTANGTTKKVASTSFSSESSLTAKLSQHINGVASFSAQSSLTANGTKRYNGIASFSAQSSLTANGKRTAKGVASFSAQSSLTANGTRRARGVAAFSSETSFTANGTRRARGIAAFSSEASMTTNGTKRVRGYAAFTSESSLTANGKRTAKGNVSFSAQSSLTANGTKRYNGIASFSAQSSLTANGKRTANGVASFSAQSSLTANGTVKKIAVASFSAQSSLTAIGTKRYNGIASFSAQSSLTANGKRTANGVALFSAQSSLTAIGTKRYNGIASFSAQSSLTANGKRTANGVASFSAQSSLTANGTRRARGVAAFSAEGSMTTNGVKTIRGYASFSSESSITANGQRKALAAVSFSAQSSLTSNATVKKVASASFSAQSSLTANGTKRFNGAASFSAQSSLTAIGKRTAKGVASFSAQSSLTANGTKRYNGVASFTAQSSLTAIGKRTAKGVATFSAQSSITPNATRKVFGVASFSSEGILSTNGVNTVRGYCTFSSQSSLTANATRKIFGTATVLSSQSVLTANGTRKTYASSSMVAQSSLTAAGKRKAVASVSLSSQSSLTAIGKRKAVASASMSAQSSLTARGLRKVIGSTVMTGEGILTAVGTTVNASIGYFGIPMS